MNHRAEYLHHRTFRSKAIIQHTQTHTHTHTHICVWHWNPAHQA